MLDGHEPDRSAHEQLRHQRVELERAVLHVTEREQRIDQVQSEDSEHQHGMPALDRADQQ